MNVDERIFWKEKQKTPQSDFLNFLGIYFSEYTLCLLLLEKIHKQNPVNVNLNVNLNLSLILANELEKISLQVLTFANGPWKENFLIIDFHQIDQNSRNSGKLVSQRFVFNKFILLK